MNKLTVQDLRSLKPGDKVYKNSGLTFRTLHFVGNMQPNSPNYLIFCDGEHLEHLYISDKDDSFRGDWYNSKFVGEIKIKHLKEQIESINNIYINEG